MIGSAAANSTGKIAFGIVTFRECYYDTAAFRSIILATTFFRERVNLSIYVYDNTDKVDWVVPPPTNGIIGRVRYFHNPANPGISVAYNYMARQGLEDGHQWIVFLDQDTEVPPDAINHYLRSINTFPEVPLKVPTLSVNGRTFSPSCFYFMRSMPMKPLSPGIHSLKGMTMVNSGMLVNLEFYHYIGGYYEKLRLDFTDTAFFEKAKRTNERFELLPFQCLHSFSDTGRDKISAYFRFRIYAKDLNNYPVSNFKDSVALWWVGFLHTLKLSCKFRSMQFILIFFKRSKL